MCPTTIDSSVLFFIIKLLVLVWLVVFPMGILRRLDKIIKLLEKN